jgi:methionine-rich copper-binding protein CopC
MNRVSSWLLATLLVVVDASAALAHAFPDRTTPTAASVVTEQPSQVVMHFDNAFDPASTKVRVLNENGDVMSGASRSSVDHRTLFTELKRVGRGQYFVKWSALSQDGDRTMGAFSFTYKPEPH